MPRTPAEEFTSLRARLNAYCSEPEEVFEDVLAKHLGLERPPDCSQNEWRALRGQFINHATDNDPQAEALAEALIDEPCKAEVLLR